MKDNKVVTPMDDGIREEARGVPRANHPRVCGAIKQLVSEVTALFPETGMAYDDLDGRNTSLSVTFDFSALDEDTDRVDASYLIRVLIDGAYNDDPRIWRGSVSDDGSSAYVLMRSSLRTQDNQNPFGLAEALTVLAGEDESEGDLWEDDEDFVEKQFITVEEGYPAWGGESS